MKKRISIIMLLTISVLMTGCEELHKKPLAYIETNADDRQSETSETETKKKKETEPETFAEAFISVPLTEGKHDIELIYTTPGLKTGAMISLGCLILFLLSAFWRGKQEKNIVVSESLC